MTSKFIMELEKGVSVLIEADSIKEAKELLKQQFGETLQEAPVIDTTEKKKEIPKGLYGHLLSLEQEDFFSTPRSLGDIKNRLKELTIFYPSTTFPVYLNRLVKERILRRFQDNTGGKKRWVYVNA